MHSYLNKRKDVFNTKNTHCEKRGKNPTSLSVRETNHFSNLYSKKITVNDIESMKEGSNMRVSRGGNDKGKIDAQQRGKIVINNSRFEFWVVILCVIVIA